MKNYILLFSAVLLLSCNKKSSKTNDSVVLPQNESISLGLITQWPDVIEGCSCYGSPSKKEFDSDHYSYIHDFNNTALLKINDKIEEFKIDGTPTKNTPNTTTTTFLNPQYKCVISTTKVSTADETWQHKGSITITSKNGTVLTQIIYGECGC